MITEQLVKEVEGTLNKLEDLCGQLDFILEKERYLVQVGYHNKSRINQVKIAKSKLNEAERMIKEAYS